MKFKFSATLDYGNEKEYCVCSNINKAVNLCKEYIFIYTDCCVKCTYNVHCTYIPMYSNIQTKFVLLSFWAQN